MFNALFHLLTFLLVVLPIYILFNLVFLATITFLFLLEIILGPENFQRVLIYVAEIVIDYFIS